MGSGDAEVGLVRSARPGFPGASSSASLGSPTPPDRRTSAAAQTGFRETTASVLYGASATRARVTVPEEQLLTLEVNGRELITLLASPGERLELAVGFLFNEGIIHDMGQIDELTEDEAGVRIEAAGVEMGLNLFERRVLGSGCGKATGFLSALDVLAAPGRMLPCDIPWIGASALVAAAKATYSQGKLYRSTRGTHAAALFDRQGRLAALSEDIGRHNAVDKAVGTRLLTGTGLDGLFLVVTGRISSEMVAKVAKTPIPLIVSKSVPTALALEHAERLALALVARSRNRLIAYTYPQLVDPAG